MDNDEIKKYINKIALYEVDLIKINSVITTCIKLLKVEGANTKKEVLDLLTETQKKYLKEYMVIKNGKREINS